MTKEQVLTEIFENDPFQLLEDIKIEKRSDYQWFVKRGNLQFVHFSKDGYVSNDCAVLTVEDVFLSVSEFDERFKPLFIALHNYKSKE